MAMRLDRLVSVELALVARAVSQRQSTTAAEQSVHEVSLAHAPFFLETPAAVELAVLKVFLAPASALQ